jgi:PAS domain S-box-containing protein
MSGTQRPPVGLLLVSGGGTNATRATLDAQPEFAVSAVSPAEVPSRLDAVDCVVAVHGDGVDGVDVLERVRAHRPELPVVLVADADDGSVVSRAVAADVSEFVPTGDDERLLDRVRAAVGTTPPIRADGAARMPIETMGVQEELRLKERAMDEAPVGITITDPNRPDNPMIYVNDAFERLTGYPKERTVGRNCRFLQGEETDPEATDTMREAVNTGEPTSVELVNYRENGEQFWNQVTIAPVRNADGETTHFVGFQMDVTERKEAELEVKRERENLQHLLVRIDGLLKEVTGELMQAERRADVETAVCDCIAAVDAYEFAWVGTPDRRSDTLTAGVWTPTEDALEADCSEPGVHAATVEAYETGSVQVVDDPAVLSDALAESPWIAADTLGGIAAIPLVYGETTYGVLTLYTTDEETLTDHEAVVLEALGRSTATAINALERGRLLATDSVTELEIETEDDSLFFVDISKRTGCSLEYDGSVYKEDGTVLTFFRTDLDVGSVLEAVDSYPNIESAEPIGKYDDETLFEFRLTESSIAATLAERGAKICTISVVDGIAMIQIEFPSATGVRAIADFIEERYPEARIVAQRERERPPSTRQEFVADIEDRLTERQLTALRKAHVSGFYEWNRPITGDALAESMGIGRSTYHQHLRAAERKLIEAFFEQ